MGDDKLHNAQCEIGKTFGNEKGEYVRRQNQWATNKQ
jgi:hypothetical protein